MKTLLITRAIALIATFLATAVSATPARASDCPIGQTVFTDGLYGIGAGFLIGGLYMLANPNSTKSGDVIPTSATAALIGGGVGAAIGIAEVGICINDRNSSKKSGMIVPYPSILLAKKKDGSNTAKFGFSVSYYM